ncbi:beta-lactamase family protein [Sinomicrobium kalidii]|uniref:serine hydrolase domain-containing protein n=1 Tax=Sinomicrobium kalidii TaxID=2900738 RepID=UPI001E57B94B|nr:serine hydrolase domain-containing protein [Sinomicrobium kalidii]UGU15500.1 beta-lactamase family protein [Sinomicrobium kalidii]
MNRVIRPQFLILFLLISFSCKTNRDSTPQNINKFREDHPQFSSKFETRLKGIFKEKELFGDFIFAVVDENGLAYSFAFNREILNGKESSLDNNSPIYIASGTKSFTGTLLKILEQKKILELNKSLHDYLPQLNYNDSIDTENITIKSLLNHTHGTFSTSMTWKTAFLGYSGKNEELINDLNTDFLLDPSGKFRYSNVGPIIAGMVVENVTGKTWKSEMKDYIFTPLKMENTSANVSDYKLRDIRPSLTVSNEKGVIEKGFYKNDITMHAAGGIISTVNDLSKWLSTNIGEGTVLLNKNSWSELHTSTTSQDREYFTYHRSGYSLGWDVAEYQNEKILTRFGGLAGISFHMSFMPEKKVGVIAFSNDNRAYLLPHLMADYAYNLINTLPADSIFRSEKPKFDKSFERENEIAYPKDSQILTASNDNDKIAGAYQNAENWPAISIDKKDDYYIFNWGILKGKIYKNEENGYFSNLGVLTRDFEITNDTLLTGSLIYKKAKE